MKRLRTLRVCALPLTLGLTLSLLTGCGHPPHGLTLLALPIDPPDTPVATPTTAQVSTPVAATIVLRRVHIPEYLQSNHVRFRTSAETLSEWPDTRWAERLEVSLTRHLRLQLGSLWPAGVLCDTHCPDSARTASLQVNYQTLDYLRPRGVMQAQVSWSLTPPSGATLAARQGRFSLSEPVSTDNAAGQAAAMARLNAQLAQHVAQGLAP